MWNTRRHPRMSLQSLSCPYIQPTPFTAKSFISYTVSPPPRPFTPILPLLLFQLVQQFNLLLLHPIHQSSCSLEIPLCLCDILQQQKEPNSQKLATFEVQNCLKKRIRTREQKVLMIYFRGCYWKKVDLPKSPGHKHQKNLLNLLQL